MDDFTIPKPVPIEVNKIEDENNIEKEEEIKDEIEDKNEKKEVNEDEAEEFKVDPKEFEFNDQPEIKIETEEDLKNIDKDSEKIEIENIIKLKDSLNVEVVLEKLKKTAFTKLEL